MSAFQNLQVDPMGRVVDVVLDRPVSLTFPDENFRFDIDLVRPLGKDLSIAAGDLTGDGFNDLLAIGWNGDVHFFPGIDSSPIRFGDGRLVAHTDSSSTPYEFGAGRWQRSAIADLDGDQVPEAVLGRRIYKQVVAHDPTRLTNVYELGAGFYFDPYPVIADFNGDNKPDILLTASYTRTPEVYWNRCQPGAFDFQRENWADAPIKHPAAGDLNGDGLIDLINDTRVFYNQGTLQVPSYNWASPADLFIDQDPWLNAVSSDQGVTICLIDADADGRLDAYLSNYGYSVWQGVFYRNTGTQTEPRFSFVSPIVCRSTPYDHSYYSDDIPNIGGSSAMGAPADFNGDGLVDFGLPSTSSGAVLWNRGDSPPYGFSWLDPYTDLDESYPSLRPYDMWTRRHWLAPYFYEFLDLTGDGLEDQLSGPALSLVTRLPGSLFDFGQTGDDGPPKQPINTTTGNPVRGYGFAEVDIDQDGVQDLVMGQEDGTQLLWYRRSGPAGSLVFEDAAPVKSSDDATLATPEGPWPAATDWDGDGDQDLLVGGEDGRLIVYLNQDAKFSPGPALSAGAWNPLDLHSTVGGGLLSPCPSTADLDGNGRDDFLIPVPGGFSVVWWLADTGQQAGEHSLSIAPIGVDRTIPGRVVQLNDRTFRLFFGFPVLPGETKVSFYPAFNSSEASTATIQPQTVFYIPQVAAGTLGQFSIATSLNVANKGHETTVLVEFFNQAGEPGAFNVAGTGVVSSVSLTLAAAESATLMLPRAGDLKIGYARVSASPEVFAGVIYEFFQGEVRLYETAVPAARGMTDFTLIVDPSSGTRDTGTAFVNVGGQAANITFRLYSDQFQLKATRTLAELGRSLGPGAHLACYASEIFPEINAPETSFGDRVGTITVESSQPLAAMALLQTDDPKLSFPDEVPTTSAFPVFPGRAELPPTENWDATWYFPQVAVGTEGSFEVETTFYFVETGQRGTGDSGQIACFDGAGQRLPVFPFAGGATSSSYLYPARGRIYKQRTINGGSLQTGYARFSSYSSFFATAVFTWKQNGKRLFDTGVPASRETNRLTLCVDLSLPSRDTGVAFAQPSPSAAQRRLLLYDQAGRLFASKTEAVPESGGDSGPRVSQFVTELFDSLRAQGFSRGLLTIESNSPLAAVALRQDDDTTLAFPLDIYQFAVFPVEPGGPPR